MDGCNLIIYGSIDDILDYFVMWLTSRSKFQENVYTEFSEK